MVDKAISINRNCARAWLNRGNIFARFKNDNDEAKKCYEKAHQLDPKLHEAITNLGNLLYLGDRFVDAAYKYLAALELDPEDSESLCNLGMALGKTKYREFATLAFDEAITSGSGNEMIITNYLYFLLDTKNWTKFDQVIIHASKYIGDAQVKTFKQIRGDFFKALKDVKESVVLENNLDREI